MNILGISAYYHDSAACLVQDGNVIAAAQEERFTRTKHDPRFPRNSVLYCLKEAGLKLDDISHITFYDRPGLKWKRILDTYTSCTASGNKVFWEAVNRWCSPFNPLSDLETQIKELGSDSYGQFKGDINFIEHHESHAASSFFSSPFNDSAILTMDGVGEYATTTIGVGEGNKLQILKQIDFPHSLGLMYSAFTYYLGFRVNSGEYKVMGLSPYGSPKYADLIRDNLISWHDDGSFKLNLKYFDNFAGERMISKDFTKLFDLPPRKPESDMTQKHCDIATSIQKIIEEAVIKLAEHAKEITNKKNLCLAGGVALNCVANGRLHKKGIFDNIWIQPASGDAGGALGAALHAYYSATESNRVQTSSQNGLGDTYLGPSYSNDDIKAFLNKSGYPHIELTDDELFEQVSELISQGSVVGWFSGRMEFGPRALGNRSILGDPRSEKMQTILNLKIKYRESFRPFAPAILADRMEDFFDLEIDSPYMLLVAQLLDKHRLPLPENHGDFKHIEKIKLPNSVIPAVTHVDHSARVQSVHKETNPRFYELIKRFDDKTGIPILINTSFNVRGEPIVCSPQDAYACFMNTQMDVLVLENHLLIKENQPVYFDNSNRNTFEPD